MLRLNRTDNLPATIEIEIITRLYAAMPQILCIAAGLVVGSAIMASRTGDPVLWVIFGAAVVTSLARVAGIIAFNRRSLRALSLEQARSWEDLYAWAAFAFTAVIAALTIRIFQAGYSDGYILTVGLTMALTAGSCARTLRFWICATLSTLALGVLIGAMMLTGDILLQSMGLLLALYLYSVYESSAHIVSQIEAVLVAERELDIAARRDALTGIANRRAFDEALATAAVSQDAFALLLLDLDGFKAINDKLGHAAGDDLLRQVADRLAAVTRGGDLLARLGGDEFAVVAHGADVSAARVLAERAVAAVGLPYVVLGSPAIVGTSIGIKAIAVGDQQRDPEMVKRLADEALYAAKRSGKGRANVAGMRDAA
jgi:diguanylate cyclase (GGDEF)-like protein